MIEPLFPNFRCAEYGGLIKQVPPDNWQIMEKMNEIIAVLNLKEAEGEKTNEL